MNNTTLWLLATLVLTACFWMPYILDRFIRIGILRTLGNPQASDTEAQSVWARRAQRAHSNAVENLAVFAPVALLALHLGLGDAALVTNASALYFFARAAHYVVYVLGIPALRTLTFLAGFAAQLAIAVAVARAGGVL
jgi:uncharacterized MAPEG superfamily protein